MREGVWITFGFFEFDFLFFHYGILKFVNFIFIKILKLKDGKIEIKHNLNF